MATLDPHDGLPQGYLSNSQVSNYLKCGHRYKLRYVDRIKEAGSLNMIEGIAHHHWFEVNGKHWMETGSLLPTGDLEALFVEKFNAMADDLASKFPETADTVEVGRQGPLLRAGAMVQAVLDDWWDVNPDTVVGFETKIEIDVRGYPVIGFIDLETTDRLYDLKVGKAKRAMDVEESMQLHLYSAAKGVDDVSFISLDNKRIAAKELAYRVTDQDREHSFDIIELVGKAIEAGVFPKTDPSNWWCGEKWCGYWSQCRGKGRKA